MRRAGRFLGAVGLVALCVTLAPFLLLGAVLFLLAAFAAILGGLAWVGSLTAYVRYQIWRITR